MVGFRVLGDPSAVLLLNLFDNRKQVGNVVLPQSRGLIGLVGSFPATAKTTSTALRIWMRREIKRKHDRYGPFSVFSTAHTTAVTGVGR
jgi:hypothetical protein